MDGIAKTLDDLRAASYELKRCLDIIVKTAPSAQEYQHLVGSDSAFFKSIFQSQEIDLEDPAIKQAVYIKELYDAGSLDSLKRVLDDETDIKDIISSFRKTHIASPQATASEKSNGSSDHFKSISTRVTSPPDESAFLSSGVLNSLTTYDLSEFQHEPEANGAHGCTIDMPDNFHKREKNQNIISKEDLPRPPAIHDVSLLNKIFTHQSIVNNIYTSETNKVQFHNERVEFLGDAFLQFITTMMIYERFPNFSEGQLSLLRASIVSNKNLLEWSKLYKFDKALKKNFNDSAITGDNKLYADVFEAYLGGLVEQYMIETDDGLTNMADFMKCWFDAKGWIETLSESKIQSFDKNLYYKMQYSKTAKQDIRNLIGVINVPEYLRVELEDRSFISCVKIQNMVYGYGLGTSNKEADARAATDAMRNPSFRRLCQDDIWNKYENTVGLNQNGGLNFTESSQSITKDQLNKLTREILTKYKNGDFKLLDSDNNPTAMLINDSIRSEFNSELKSKYSITDDYVEDSSYYNPMITRGRGGVFNEQESKRVKKRKLKEIDGGITRNVPYILDDGSKILCHEVLISPSEIDRDSKNKINSMFHKRGSAPDYRLLRTNDDYYLCELWYGSDQIVSYGMARTKQDASQLAAQLAFIREEYFGYETQL